MAHNYRLICDFHVGYDDELEELVWDLNGMTVYTWVNNAPYPSVQGKLIGHVQGMPGSEPENIHFSSLSYDLEGNYTCKVRTQKGTAERSFYLHVVEIGESPYETDVTLLSKHQPSFGEGSKYNLYDGTDYDVPGGPEDDPVLLEGGGENEEDPGCTLVWDFRTPAIYPRPNVTCGYYSYLHDDVVEPLPAGLTLRQFTNGSWQAFLEGTHIEVSRVPPTSRLGCSIGIPDTSYRKIVKFEDGFTIDELIDTKGCPALERHETTSSLRVIYLEAQHTCRDTVVPTNRNLPAKAAVRCPLDHAAVFPDGSMEWDWEAQLACGDQEDAWREVTETEDGRHVMGDALDVETLPICVIGVNSGDRPTPIVWGSLVLLVAPLLLVPS
ncbi:uncharacterized protein LOC143032773 [Oratosquilla oratoria]|uniref:uncharacterized protein LOC143032773 n=1 Tax=Oratosquilla oratoria TaxID=337810 RepID=UPI003F766458